MRTLPVLCLALLACACGGGKGEKFVPDQTSFEGAVEAYARSMEDGEESYASDIFTPAEQERQMVGLRGDIQRAKEAGLRYKVLTDTAEPHPSVDNAFVVRLTRVQVNEANEEVGESVSTWTVFTKESDGKWRLNGRLSTEFRHFYEAAEKARKEAAANAPANAPANTPANAPAGNGR